MEAKPNMIKKYNKPVIGLVAGLIIPLISFLIYYLYLTSINSDLALLDYISTLDANNAFTPVLSICVLPNLLLYFLFKKLDYWYSIKGVIFSILFYTILVIVLKFS